MPSIHDAYVFQGVESGVCDRETLLSDSDYVVEDIHDILDVVLPGRLHTDEMSRWVYFQMFCIW